ncbi:hypothetical protein [Mesorhizobium sp. B4-1-4]|uniref:hypothetical protein n=1 Tax=Mesorhizobium sp. B4-1-4 TaxID=2589888 RepID=UPI0011291C3D|nr:hypothetical protein [Mesorhizobium sp. B4-1-4]UCI33959.1 hypothetical protein FJW03_11315 [Mesorhizobium sp. B4-1-4]
MDWSVNENGHARIGATQACLPRLHIHFMTDWKPGHTGTMPRFSPESFGFRSGRVGNEAHRSSLGLAFNSLRASIQDMP